MKPPGAGVDGVPLQVLFGFERVHLAVGASATVSLYPSLADFTQVGGSGERYVLPGEYTIHFGVGGENAGAGGMAYAEHRVSLKTDDSTAAAMAATALTVAGVGV